MAIRLVFNPQTGWKGSVRSKPITWRELNALALLAEGCSNQEIADSMGIKYQTVKNTIYRLNKKLGAKNNAHALVIAMNAGLISIEVISDELDEELSPKRREESGKRIQQELATLDTMSKEEQERYMHGEWYHRQ